MYHNTTETNYRQNQEAAQNDENCIKQNPDSFSQCLLTDISAVCASQAEHRLPPVLQLFQLLALTLQAHLSVHCNVVQIQKVNQHVTQT